MAKAPNTRAHTPSADDRANAIDGEVVQSAERALARSDSGDLDASLAVALSESEINQQIATARRFPRPKQKAMDDLVELATQDTPTATGCVYSLPRGRDPETGKPKAITGPSVRFAEIAAQVFGNCRVAARVIAVDRKDKYVEAEGIYHDLETNYAVAARVRRRISDKRGALFSEDMIIVTGNAAASIALRNAILRGIPRPIWNRAYEKVQEVIAGDAKTIGARRVELLTRFRDELSVKPAVLFNLLGVTGELDIGRDELVVAAGFFTALRNNETTVEDLLREGGQTPDVGHRTLANAHGGVDRPQEAGHDPETGEVRETTAKAPEAASDPSQAEREAIERHSGSGGTGARPTETANAQRAASKPASSASATAASGASPAATSSPAPKSPQSDAGETQARAEAALAAADPKKAAPPPADLDDEVQEGCASPGEIYFHADDAWGEDGRRPTYMDGARFSSSSRKKFEDGEIFIFAEHAPDDPPPMRDPSLPVGPEVAPEDPAADTGMTTVEVEEPAPSTIDSALAEAIEDFRQECRGAPSWLTIKQALSKLQKAPSFADIPEAHQRAEFVFAYMAGDALAKADRDPVKITDDPAFYQLWLQTEPEPHEVYETWARLVRSPAYRQLKPAQQDALAERTMKAQGDQA